MFHYKDPCIIEKSDFQECGTVVSFSTLTNVVMGFEWIILAQRSRQLFCLVKTFKWKHANHQNWCCSFNNTGSIILHFHTLGARFQPAAVLEDAGDSPHIKSLSPLSPARPLFLMLRAADVEFTAYKKYIYIFYFIQSSLISALCTREQVDRMYSGGFRSNHVEKQPV